MNLKITLIVSLLILSTIGTIWWFSTDKAQNPTRKLSITREELTPTSTPLPLLKYAIPQLKALQSQPQQALQVKKIITQDLESNLYTFLISYQSQGKTISGALTLKLESANSATSNPITESTLPTPTALPIIIMLRGYVPLEIYSPGVGTKNAASAFANQGYLTIAPDFLGFGESDTEPTDTWEARFLKPLNIMDLLATLQKFPTINLSAFPKLPVTTVTLDPQKIGIWAHSNGGQIAVTTLEALAEPIPTTLWAPVLAPFPYSILYFSDEYEDEGKEMRKYLSQFEENYDVFDFSLTKHLSHLQGPLQIHHGGRDDSALLSWSEEFLAKVDLENERRNNESTKSATLAAQLKKIEVNFYSYPNADHNLQPNWEQAIQRDLEFFEKNLRNKK